MCLLTHGNVAQYTYTTQIDPEHMTPPQTGIKSTDSYPLTCVSIFRAYDTSSSPVRKQLQHASDHLALLPPGELLPRRCHGDRLHHLRWRDRCCCRLWGHPQQRKPQEVEFFSHCSWFIQLFFRFQGIPFAQVILGSFLDFSQNCKPNYPFFPIGSPQNLSKIDKLKCFLK